MGTKVFKGFRVSALWNFPGMQIKPVWIPPFFPAGCKVEWKEHRTIRFQHGVLWPLGIIGLGILWKPVRGEPVHLVLMVAFHLMCRYTTSNIFGCTEYCHSPRAVHLGKWLFFKERLLQKGSSKCQRSIGGLYRATAQLELRSRDVLGWGWGFPLNIDMFSKIMENHGCSF